jgi:hypothetical protein
MASLTFSLQLDDCGFPGSSSECLMDLETQLISLEMASWGDDLATAVSTCAVSPVVLNPVPRQTISYYTHSDSPGSYDHRSWLWLQLSHYIRKGIDTAITRASP